MIDSTPESIPYQQALLTWCQQHIQQDILSSEAVSGDAGFRKYFRLQCADQSFIAVYAPPETEKNHAFVALAEMLCSHAIHAPTVYGVDYSRGFLLISDLGSRLLLPELTRDSADALYRQCLDTIVAMQKIDKDAVPAGRYDRQALQIELDVFPEWFVKQLLAYDLTDDEQVMLASLNQWLIESALAQPQAFVHRDYHSRNLLCSEDTMGVIDFQDGLWGPCTYDVVSLLKDCYIQWPEQDVHAWLSYYHQTMPFENKPDFATLLQQFDLMGLQRHIKVLGVFARLSLRDGKHGYLQDLPTVIHYVVATAKKYPEAQAFAEWFETRLMVLIEQQPWSYT